MQFFKAIGRQFTIINKRICARNTFFMALIFLFVIQPGLRAQHSQTIYFIDRLPQSSLLNPAHQHHHNFHLGLPGISSFNVNAETNFLSFSDIIFRHPTQDSLITFLHPDADINDFASGLRKSNDITPGLHLNVFSLGFRAGRSFVSFNISERLSGRASLPGDLIRLGLQGNAQFEGKNADFSNIGIDLNYFREYAFGYSYQFDEKLNLGARAKVLFGKANISFNQTDIGLYTDPDTYNLRLNSEITMNMSLPLTITRNSEGDISDFRFHFDDVGYDPADFVFNTQNRGFALDLGATYRIIEPVMLYASIVDLGFINWKADVYNFSVNGDFEFEGVDLSSAFDDDDDSGVTYDFADSLQSHLSISDTRDSYSRGLPGKIFLGGTYDVTSGINVGLLGRTEIYQGRVRQAVTLSANSNVGRWLSASLSYSMMNNRYDNIGMGLSFRGGGFQLYMLTDNLNTLFIPHQTSNANLWFGLNIVFGNVKIAQALPYR